MTFKEQMALDAAGVMNVDEAAEWVTYDGARIQAVVVLGADKASGNTFSSEGQAARAVVQVLAADVAAPGQGDAIVRDADLNTTWRMARILSSFGGMHRLEVIAKESAF